MPHLSESAERRNHLLHTLGNLTLVTKKLNPKLSNAAWADKREELGAHSVLRLNHTLLASAGDTWDEEAILARSKTLAGAAARVWPRPSL
jgi:hypothetical protein